MATHSSILAWEIPWTEGPGGLRSTGFQRVRRELAIKFEKEMATHSSILAWRIPWAEKPGGLLFMGSHRVGHHRSDLHALEKETAAPSSVPAWRIPGMGEPGGLLSMGQHRVKRLKQLSGSSSSEQNLSHSKSPLAIYLTYGNVYISMPASQFIPPLLLPPPCSQACSLRLRLHCAPESRCHMHALIYSICLSFSDLLHILQ